MFLNVKHDWSRTANFSSSENMFYFKFVDFEYFSISVFIIVIQLNDCCISTFVGHIVKFLYNKTNLLQAIFLVLCFLKFLW